MDEQRVDVPAPDRGLLEQARAELAALADPAAAQHLQRFFRTGPGQYGEGDRFLGVRVPDTRTVARRHAGLSLAACRELLDSPWHEERLLGLLVMVRAYDRGDDTRRDDVFALYLGSTHRINNWDLVDVSAEHIAGRHLRHGDRSLLYVLAASGSLWERRIAVLATFHFIKAGDFDDTLKLARLLLEDRHDLMHKAVGWMLREVGKRDTARLVSFLDEHAAVMPRTMLRYAIERFEPGARAEWLSRRSLSSAHSPTRRSAR